MATVEKIRRDIEKTKEKISEQQKRLRTLEAQLTEEENLEIVRMVKAVKMDNRELTAFLKAYASGLITLPEGMMEAEAAADPGEEDMEDHENEEKKDHPPVYVDAGRGALYHGFCGSGLRRRRGWRTLLHGNGRDRGRSHGGCRVPGGHCDR